MSGPRDQSLSTPLPGRYSLIHLGGLLYEATLSGNLTVDKTYPTLCKLDPNGANRDITLEAESAANEGLFRVFANAADAAENLVVKDPDGNTVGTINQNELGVFYCKGASGWTLVYIQTIALS